MRDRKEMKVDVEVERKNTKKKGKESNLVVEMLSFSLYLLAVLVGAYLLVRFVGQRTEVIGGSMENTLIDGDNLLVDKISYRFKDPERFEIVVFPYRYDRAMFYVKRIIGLPGETVEINEDGEIFIDGVKLQEFYGKETIHNPGRAIEPVYLSDDEYFVLGDNRNNSSDSRFEDVGNIKRDDLIGRAILRVWPVGKLGLIE